MEMNFQKYRIIDINQSQVKAAAQFMYRDFEVSFSTICSPFPTMVVVFEDGQFVSEHATVEDAINWINEVKK